MRRDGIDASQAYADAARKTPLLTAEEETSLGRRSLAGDMEARHELVRRNQRLVIWITNRFSKSAPEDGDDLISEGNIGLMRAATDWNPDRCRFSTYAKPWIRGQVRLYLIERKPVIRIPNELYEIQSKIRRGVELTERQVKHWESLGKYTEAGIVEVDGIDGGWASVARSYDDPSVSVENSAAVQAALSCLSGRERAIAWEHAGMGDGFQKIGRRLGISRERARQLCERAMTKVRDNQRRMAS